ncbi:MAG: hypothetical protein ACO1TE_23650 [Prosthecobacter sp.]
MRNNVIFYHPAPFVPLSENDGIPSTAGADWFVALLRRVEGVIITEDLCQEDWGVVVFVKRAGRSFWIGLGCGPEDDHSWLAHLHHGSFAWLQRWSAKGRRELDRLICDFHSMLVSEAEVRDIAWYDEREMQGANVSAGAPSPDAAQP